MPPRRSARVAAVEERATSALSPLPLSVVLHIFSLLPVECRLRCSEVCRGWRSVLLERSLWTRLDLTEASGVRVRVGRHGEAAAFDGLLGCAAARAGGGLQALRVQKHAALEQPLLAVVAANAGALRELCLSDDVNHVGFTPAEIQALCVAAPQLRVFTTDVCCGPTNANDARRMLRNEAPFEVLRVQRLRAFLPELDEAGVVAFAASVAAHASLEGLILYRASLTTPAALDAVIDAALAHRLHSVELCDCGLTPVSAPALARLLGSGALTTLECSNATMLDMPAARVLAAALRANATLTSLELNHAGVWRDPAAAAELLGALMGHTSVQVLSLRENYMAAADQAAVGTALGALIAANAPALTELDVAECGLGDDGLRALFEALPANSHLRTLNCRFNDMDAAFARDVALPAVRANASLREVKLDWGTSDAGEDIARELRSRAPQQ
jgi:hypothetical protein